MLAFDAKKRSFGSQQRVGSRNNMMNVAKASSENQASSGNAASSSGWGSQGNASSSVAASTRGWGNGSKGSWSPNGWGRSRSSNSSSSSGWGSSSGSGRSSGWGSGASGSSVRASVNSNSGTGNPPAEVNLRKFKGKVDMCYLLAKGWMEPPRPVYHGSWVTIPHREHSGYGKTFRRGHAEYYRGKVVAIKLNDRKVLVRYNLMSWWPRERKYTYYNGHEEWYKIEDVASVHDGPTNDPPYTFVARGYSMG